MRTFLTALCGVALFLTSGIAGAEQIASVVTIRGKATVERGSKKIDAQPKLGIELQDTVATAEGGRAKLLFIDDSVLTLAEKSRMSIDTFVHSRSDRGQSVFNLLDGKMRAVVGKTRFEVKTPTVVAAARGTVILFDVGTLNGRSFTRITCLEGIVDVRSLTAPPGAKPILLSAGQTIVIMAKPLPATEQKSSRQEQKSSKQEQSTSTPAPEPAPVPEQLSPVELEKLKKETSTSGGEIKLPDAAPATVIKNVVITPVLTTTTPPVIPPVRTQPTKVNIGVKF